MDAAARATEVGSAIKEALDFETEPPLKVVFGVARKGRRSADAVCRTLGADRLLRLQDIARRDAIEVGVSSSAICHPYAR